MTDRHGVLYVCLYVMYGLFINEKFVHNQLAVYRLKSVRQILAVVEEYHHNRQHCTALPDSLVTEDHKT